MPPKYTIAKPVWRLCGGAYYVLLSLFMTLLMYAIHDHDIVTVIVRATCEINLGALYMYTHGSPAPGVRVGVFMRVKANAKWCAGCVYQ